MINLLLSILIGYALNYFQLNYFQLNLILTITIIFIVLTLFNGGLFEGFASETDRTIHYGDIITLWTWKNSYLRADLNVKDIVAVQDGKNVKKGLVHITSQLPSPSDLPRGWTREHWTIEDSNDPHAGPGNRNQVRFGDKIFLRSWRATYLQADDKNNIYQSSDRSTWETFTLESPEVTAKSGTPISYGDMCYLKTWRESYISVSETESAVIQEFAKTPHALIYLYDHYGEGTLTDWARRGLASQSSTYGQYPAINAIDGNFMTFSHTLEEQGAWWQVKLPKDVNVSEIHIKNRVDCCQNRLSDFDVLLLNQNGDVMMSKRFNTTQQDYSIMNVGVVGRIVRIQLRNKQFLHLSGVKVYGQAVEYSSLLEKPVISELIPNETTITATNGKTIYNEDLPYIGVGNNMSLLTYIYPNGEAYLNGMRVICNKGGMPLVLLNRGILEVKLRTKNNSQFTLSTNYMLPVKQWSHLALVINGGISIATGWAYGKIAGISPSAPTGVSPTNSYVVNQQLKQYYIAQIPEGVPQNNWDSSIISNMTFLGELDQDKPSVMVYVNGQLVSHAILDGDPVFTQSALQLGSSDVYQGLNYQVKALKFYNYAVESKTIQRELNGRNYDKKCLPDVRTEYQPEYKPEYKPEYQLKQKYPQPEYKQEYKREQEYQQPEYKPKHKKQEEEWQEILNEETRKLAEGSELTPEIIGNIIRAKEQLSEDPEFQEIVQQVKNYGQAEGATQHPEYQELVRDLNELAGRAEGESKPFTNKMAQLKVQANKCKALLTGDSSNIPKKTIIDLFKRRAEVGDAQYRALINNILGSLAQTDARLKSILENAQNQGKQNDTKYRNFVQRVALKHILTDSTYKQTFMNLVQSDINTYCNTLSPKNGNGKSWFSCLW